MKFRKLGFERRKEELEEEIQAHLRMDIAGRMERGAAREEAEAAARREFGNAGLVREVTHGFWRWGRMERLLNDLKYTVRVLRRSPGFSVAVILTLAVGIGAACAMFTVVDRVLLRRLPFPHAEELVHIDESGKRGTSNGAPYLDIEQWRSRSHAVQEIAYYEATPENAVAFLQSGRGTIHVDVASASGNLFQTLGVKPQLGRGFQPDTKTGAVIPQDENSLILSNAAWRVAFSADPAVLGRSVHINGEAFTIVGVMPGGLNFPYGGQFPVVWKPVVLGPNDAARSHRDVRYYDTIARVPGKLLAQAKSELGAIQAESAKQYPDAADRENHSGINLVRHTDTLVDGTLKKSLLALFGASGLLWLIACVNVTSLMLARAASRQREMAVRGALGAGRWQIARHALLEGLLLGVCGSLLGLGLAMATLRIFEHALSTQFKIHERLAPNLSVLAGLLAITLLSAVLISAWPALAAAHARIEPMLRQGGLQSGAGRARHRLRSLLVIAEIALSLTLMTGCGLLLRTIYALQHVPLGFRTEHILVADMSIPAYRFQGRNMTAEFYQPLADRVKRLPGVEGASLMTDVPMGMTYRLLFTFRADGKSADDMRRNSLDAEFRAVGPEMQQVFGFRMLRGRFFNEGDTASSQAVAVVNRAFVQAYFGDDRDPSKILGENLLSLDKQRRSVVVGVVDDERQVSAAKPSMPEIEICIPQITPQTGFYRVTEGFSMALAVRTNLKPEAILPALREAMRQASPDLADSKFTTMDQIVEDSYGSQRLAAELLEIFAGSALLLCVAGIYGLLAYLVAQRTREMGVRIALGAQRWNVMSLVLRQAAWMLTGGLALGLGLAWVASRGLRSFLYDVKPDDPWTMVAVTALLLVSGLAAAYWPARKASRVDPMEALRAE